MKEESCEFCGRKRGVEGRVINKRKVTLCLVCYGKMMKIFYPKRIQKTCEVCGKTYFVAPCFAGSKYDSRKCFNEAMRSRFKGKK